MKAMVNYVRKRVEKGRLDLDKVEAMLLIPTPESEELLVDTNFITATYRHVEETDSMSTAVFENMIRNNNIKADLLLELTQTVAMEKQHQEE